MSCLYANVRIYARQRCVRAVVNLQASLWLAVLCCLALSGCSGAPAAEPAAVKGTVKFNGEPVASGGIRLSTEDGTPGPGGISPIKDGQYEIPETSGLKAGKYLVVINAFKKTGRKIKVDEAGTEKEEEKQYLPRRYNDASDVHLELMPGDNTKDFDLTN